MYMPKEEKHRLWEERIQEFRSSGQTCKAWCWNNRYQLLPLITGCESKNPSAPDTLFAKLPTEEELLRNEDSNTTLPMRIFIITVP